MARRYQETESSLVRDNLQKFLQKTSCPDCFWVRLKLPYRNVFVGDSNFPINRHVYRGELRYLKNLTFEGNRVRCEKILKGKIFARLEFL
ncbi:MAG: hypothetical protein Ct9H90mP27_0520 [Gammaproteobacteria bacterium]|nr:MAG: hypothetical protein Ct9H90mP27_0520 [Gammaproteobacteria bacterium]